MANLAPLAMSQKKDELLQHLEMSQETYNLMAKETDRIYKWLTSDKRHLKENCKRKPPYDWSDMLERSKDDAIELIAKSGEPHTAFYWDKANSTPGCPNWIARWFLYHKFRYRDGRNRNANKSDGSKHSAESQRSKHNYHAESSASQGYYNGHLSGYPNANLSSTNRFEVGNGYGATSSNEQSSYPEYYSNTAFQQQHSDTNQEHTFYDPVRDATRPH